MENAHPLPWTTVYVWPAIVTVPRRSASGFAATASCTLPLPVPLLPEEMVIHGALLTAVHEQPPGAVTATETVPPALATFWLEGEIEYAQPPAWFTVNVWPPAVIVPDLSGPVLTPAV